METYLLAACSSLGCWQDDKYVKEPDCLECIKDILRFLRRDKETCDIRRLLGESNLVVEDLVPLLKQYSDDAELFDAVLRLVVNLTQPPASCFGKDLPKDSITTNYYMQISSHLREYKRAFSDPSLFAIFTSKVKTFVEKDWENKSEEDRLQVERILTVAKNSLHIPAADTDETRTEDDVTIQDQIILAIKTSGFDQLLLTICSSKGERPLVIYGIEIVCLMLREKRVEDVAQTGSSYTEGASNKTRANSIDSQELESLINREASKKRVFHTIAQRRHSAFGGSYVVKGVKSVNDNNDVVSTRVVKDSNSLQFDHGKRAKRLPKNKVTPADEPELRRSALKVRTFLHQFCLQFLQQCYNYSVKFAKDLTASGDDRVNAELFYMWSVTFFGAFTRLAHVKLDRISETIDVQSFHFIQMRIEHHMEMIVTDKLEGRAHAKRAHTALKAYKEILKMLQFMIQHKDVLTKNKGRKLCESVFYAQEYRELFLMMLKKYNPAYMSRSFLFEMIDANHIHMKLLEDAAKEKSKFLVQRKRKKIRRSKKSGKSRKVESDEPQGEKLEELWEEMADNVSDAVKADRITDAETVAPCNFLEAEGETEQWKMAISNIKGFLVAKNVGEALAVYRSARTIWPDGPFGTFEIEPEEEVLGLREILLSKVEVVNASERENRVAAINSDEETEDEDESVEYQRSEDEFSFLEFTKKFCHGDILRAYVSALSDFPRNSASLNHSVVKFLHRMARGLGVSAVLYQASLFNIFRKLLNDPILRCDPHLKELVQFARFILEGFFKCAASNPVVFVEILFWKSYREGTEIEHGYGTFEETKKKTSHAWSEDLDVELRGLYELFMADEDLIGTGDVVGYVESNFSTTKTRRQLKKRLIQLGCEIPMVPKKSDGRRRHLASDSPDSGSDEKEAEGVGEEKSAEEPIAADPHDSHDGGESEHSADGSVCG